MLNKRILIVDDEKDITDTFKIGLEQQGFEVITYNDPELALSQFKENWFDLLLLDIKMPKISGFELYRRLNKIDSKPKVCFITAFDVYYDEFKKVFPSLEVKCFLRKPISISDLVEQQKQAILRYHSVLRVNMSLLISDEKLRRKVIKADNEMVIILQRQLDESMRMREELREKMKKEKDKKKGKSKNQKRNLLL